MSMANGDEGRARGRFEGRTALVTGAAGDIGRAVAVDLVDQGAEVILTDLERAQAGLAQTADLCSAASGHTPTIVELDVTDTAAVAEAFAGLAERDLVADLVFNNAGYQGNFANTLDYDLSDFRRVLDVNVVGAFAVLQATARALVARQRAGSIVNTASMAYTGAPNMAAYSASKAAVVAMTGAAARDLAARSIRVNCISPAFIGPGAMWDRQVALQAETPSQYYSDDTARVAAEMIGQVPLRRYGSLDEVAAATLFLLSDEASYITAFNLEVSGGV